MYSFQNKVVLITGGASGIGYLMGKKALERGAASLIIWDINEENIYRSRNELKEFGYDFHSRRVDITDEKQVKAATEELRSKNLNVDVLINNAGIVKGGKFIEQNINAIQKTMDVNALGMMRVTHFLLPNMIKRNTGYVVNIASAAGLTPNPGMAVYAASKWAAVGWSESLRLELEKDASNVKILTVMPGYIDTGMFEGVAPPKLVPLLDPNKISEKILNSVEKGKSVLREPFMIKLTPFFKGILPASVYDFVAGHFFKVYSSMDNFKGRSGSD